MQASNELYPVSTFDYTSRETHKLQRYINQNRNKRHPHQCLLQLPLDQHLDVPLDDRLLVDVRHRAFRDRQVEELADGFPAVLRAPEEETLRRRILPNMPIVLVVNSQNLRVTVRGCPDAAKEVVDIVFYAKPAAFDCQLDIEFM